MLLLVLIRAWMMDMFNDIRWKGLTQEIEVHWLRVQVGGRDCSLENIGFYGV